MNVGRYYSGDLSRKYENYPVTVGDPESWHGGVRRTLGKQIKDMKTTEHVLNRSGESIERWKNNPNYFDLKYVDTAQRYLPKIDEKGNITIFRGLNFTDFKSPYEVRLLRGIHGDSWTWNPAVAKAYGGIYGAKIVNDPHLIEKEKDIERAVILEGKTNLDNVRSIKSELSFGYEDEVRIWDQDKVKVEKYWYWDVEKKKWVWTGDVHKIIDIMKKRAKWSDY